MSGIIKSADCGALAPDQAVQQDAQEDTRLGPVAALWHLLNFFGPAIALGLITPALAKLVWRRDLNGVSWSGLALRIVVVCAAVAIAGLVTFGHDGKMATYAAMLAACALTLWWFGFASRSR
jgi:hypothetical protein